jgi:hypothetical protein
MYGTVIFNCKNAEILCLLGSAFSTLDSDPRKSMLWIRLRILDPDPDWIRIQWGLWIRIWIRTGFHFWKYWMFSEGFSCCLNVLYGGLGISKFQFLIKKRYKNYFSCIFYLVFDHQNTGSGLDRYLDSDSLETLDPPYPDPDLLNPDPQPWHKWKAARKN